jgi:hypothetical protein
MKKTTKLLALIIVLGTLSLQGCGVFKKKCDCPRFGHYFNPPAID